MILYLWTENHKEDWLVNCLLFIFFNFPCVTYKHLLNLDTCSCLEDSSGGSNWQLLVLYLQSSTDSLCLITVKHRAPCLVHTLFENQQAYLFLCLCIQVVWYHSPQGALVIVFLLIVHMFLQAGFLCFLFTSIAVSIGMHTVATCTCSDQNNILLNISWIFLTSWQWMKIWWDTIPREHEGAQRLDYKRSISWIENGNGHCSSQHRLRKWLVMSTYPATQAQIAYHLLDWVVCIVFISWMD